MKSTMPVRGSSSEDLATRVRQAALRQAASLGCADTLGALAQKPDALLKAVADATGASVGFVRQTLLADAQNALEQSRRAMEALRGGAEDAPAARTHTPLSTPGAAAGAGRPLAVRLQQARDTAPAAPVEKLQSLDLTFRLEDVQRTRIAITTDASSKALQEVVGESKKLLKLLDEIARSEPGADISQPLADVQRIYQGLTSAAARHKGIFLSRDDATVEIPGGVRGAQVGNDEAAAPASTRSSASLGTAVAIGVDPATGEKVVLEPRGRVLEDLSLSQLVQVHDARDTRERAAKVLATDPAALSSLRAFSDTELDKRGLREPSPLREFVTLQGDTGGAQAFTYPTRWVKDGGEIFSRRLIVDGPFRGIYLDDVVTHLDEKARNTSLKRATESSLHWLKPTSSSFAPVVSVVKVKQGEQEKTLLRLRVPSTREYTGVRQSLQQLSSKLEDVKLVGGSKNTLFYFEPGNLALVRKVASSFGITADAQALVQKHVDELQKYERAQTSDALETYRAANIGGFKSHVVGRDGKLKPFELSEVQRSTLARVALDGYRGAITLGMGMGKTLVAIAAMQLMMKEGEKRPFLVVVPEGLEGGFVTEVFSKLEPDAAKKLADRLVVMDHKEFRKASRTGTHEGKPFKAEAFGAVVFDEAHLLSDRRTAGGKAMLAFQHPHTFELSGTPQGQPDRLQTMDAAARGVDLNSPDEKETRKEGRKWRKFMFDEVNGIAVGVKQPFELKRGIKIDPSREMLEYIRTRFIYADSFHDDVVLPKRTDVNLTMTMPAELEKQYRAKAKPARIALEGLVSIYRDRGLEVAEDGTPLVHKDKRGQERTQLTRQSRDPRVHEIKTALKPTIAELTQLTNTVERVKHTGKKLLELMKEDEARGAVLSRAIAFTDDKDYVLESARVFSEQMPVKLHAAALGDEIRVFQNGKELTQLGPFKLPFREQSYRPDPTKPADPTTNPEIPAEGWRTFVLELLGKHKEVATTTVFGPVYQAGQNLQWANAVVHLDRDTWSDFNMRQREFRVHRRGQTRPVTVIHVDYTFTKPRSNLDRTLDSVRALQAQNDRRLIEGTLVAAQKIRLGDDQEPMRADAPFDAEADPDELDLGLLAAGAEPTAEALGNAGRP